MRFHKHHIIPHHAGGTNDPKNIVMVNIPLHAFLHKLLWEEYNNKYDYIAWQTLSGNLTNDEARIAALKVFNENYWSEENKILLGEKLRISWSSERRQVYSQKMTEDNPAKKKK